MADQDDVVPRRRQGPVGLVCDANRVQVPPAVEVHRLRQLEGLRLHLADGADRGGRGCRHDKIVVSPTPANLNWIGLYNQLPYRDDKAARERSHMTTVDNGVNVQALLDAREVLKGAPEAAQFTWRASSTWQNGVHST